MGIIYTVLAGFLIMFFVSKIIGLYLAHSAERQEQETAFSVQQSIEQEIVRHQEQCGERPTQLYLGHIEYHYLLLYCRIVTGQLVEVINWHEGMTVEKVDVESLLVIV